MKFKKFGRLPGKPSALLTLALDDLAKIEKTKGYSIFMNVWHDTHPKLASSSEQTCAVCLAGAVMVLELKAERLCRYYPRDFEEWRALQAINALRTGEVGAAFHVLQIKSPMTKGKPFNREIAAYADDARIFKRQLRALAITLEKAGY